MPKTVIKARNRTMDVELYAFQEDFSAEEPEEIVEEEESESPDYMQTVDIYEDAIAQAEEILNKARDEAESIREQARDEGFSEGYEKGYEDGHKKACEEYEQKMREDTELFMEEVKATMEEVTAKKDEIIDEYIDDLKKITLAIAEKVIHVSLSSSEEVVKRMILAATEKLKKTQWAKIYVTRSDESLNLQADKKLLKELSHVSDHIKIIAMDSEEEGTCIIELPDVVIDASVNTQLENIKDILNNARL